MAIDGSNEIDTLTKENDILRGMVAKIMPCHYCGVPTIERCPFGFPGCSLADDLICAETCQSKEIQDLRAKLADAHQEIDRLNKRVTI